MTLLEVIKSNKLFRLPEMAPKTKHEPEIWFEILNNLDLHVIGPDDVISLPKAIPTHQWKRTDFQLKQ